MKKIIVILFLIFCSTLAYADNPILLFTDIIAGPDTGLGDGAGSGAIVTVWGRNLGSSQGESTITYKAADASTYSGGHVYYWCNADGTSGGGPANLHTTLGLQEIAFSIPDVTESLPDAGSIYVTVGGVASNELSFTVNSAEIYWIAGTGNNSTGDGSYGSPWLSFGSSDSGAISKAGVSAGDIVYGIACTYTDTTITIRGSVKSGTSGNLIYLATYPGSYIRIRNTNTSVNTGGVVRFNMTPHPEYYGFSKIDIEIAHGTGMGCFLGSRYIGNEITDTNNGAGSCDGTDGGFTANYSGAANNVILGNYIHDFGDVTTSNLQHTTYFTVRNVSGADIPGFEFAYNYLNDNWARYGVHIYDEHGCFGYTSPLYIHHNWIEDQVGPGINFGAWICYDGYEVDGSAYVYNNVLVECGKEGDNSEVACAIQIQGDELTMDIYLYNNTIYGYGYSGSLPVGWDGGIVVNNTGYYNGPFAGTYEMINNIIVDTKNIAFFPASPTNKSAAVSKNNIWYDSDGTYHNPSWDSDWGSVEANPLLVNPSSDLSLQVGSPAINAGSSDVSGIVTVDFLNRPYSGETYEIGAYGAFSGTGSSTSPGFTVISGGAGFTAISGGAGFIVK